MKVKRWRTYLQSLDDVIDWEVRRDKGQVVAFAINYRVRVEEAWIEVCRYDTCHGFLHMHRLWTKQGLAQPFPGKRLPARDYRRGFRLAQQDLEANWSTYRRRMLERHRREGIE